jgi:hypothetical protein
MAKIKFNGYDAMDITTVFGSREQVTIASEAVPTQIRDVLLIQFPTTADVTVLRTIMESEDSLKLFDLIGDDNSINTYQNFVFGLGLTIDKNKIEMKVAQLSGSDVGLRAQNTLASTLVDTTAAQLIGLINDLYAELEVLKTKVGV